MKILPVLFTGVFLLGLPGSQLQGQPYGLTNRVANTTLRMPPAPPVYGYTFTNAFGPLTFSAPVGIVTPPGETNRIFIIEQAGRIAVITNLAAPNRSVFMDITSQVRFGGEQGLLGLAFHPGYATNRQFFVTYVYPPGTGTRYDRLSRFEASETNPNVGLTNSEVVLWQQMDEADNHNSGDLHFGPDGYLYGTLGDEGGGNDQFNNSQRIDKDFFSAMYRLDVDFRPDSIPANPHPSNTNNPTMTVNYAIPADNPFIGATSFNGSPVDPANVRTEFFAVGLRNAWRFSFDPVTEFIWLADVGQNAWEEVDIITKGGNYGWAVREGLHAGPKPAPAGFSAIDPIQEYGHGMATNQGNSITGGVVYRGNAIPQLYGAYIFADYVSSNVWTMRYEVSGGRTNITPFKWLLRDRGISAFGTDPRNGEVLAVSVDQGWLRRLAYGPVTGGAIPPTLADTGAFSDLETLTPQPGVIPYDVNVQSWTDNAEKKRWFSVPNVNGKISFRATNSWTFPTGAVWIQHFELQMTNGMPESRRRLETRFLVRDSGSTVYGLTYRWTSPTNAVLLDDTGLDEPLVVDDGGGILRTQVWHYPSRSECLNCHRGVAGYAVGFNTPQLNRDFDYNGTIDNQIRSLNNVGYFSTIVTNQHNLIQLASLSDTSSSAEFRARSYLMANCADCHLPGNSPAGGFDTRIYRLLAVAGIINGRLTNNLGDPNNRIVKPGSLGESVVYSRMASEQSNLRMPPLGNNLIDTEALALFREWITNDLSRYQSFADWQLAQFGNTNAPEVAALADFDGDGAKNVLEYYTQTDPNSPADFWSAGIQRANNSVELVFDQIANRGFEVQWSTNLMSTSVWNFLNIPENRPKFSSSNLTHQVPDAIGVAPKFYRVRVYEH